MIPPSQSTTRRATRLLPRLLAIAWTLGIVAACTVPGSSLPSSSLFTFDKLAHFVLFAGFGVLWMRALSRPLLRRALWVGAAGLAFAVCTEVYQGLLPFERAPDVYDALADALGVLTAVALYSLWHARRQA